MVNKTEIQFINHASILITHGEIKLLSDPWYQGEAFHKGWNLLHELSDSEIDNLLLNVSHIWISHEHPDHFSLMFFKKFGNKIKDRKIKILFQNTADKRVESYLLALNYELEIIKFNSWTSLAKDFEILCIKDGFYDSGLAIRTSDKTILNLNDCEIKDASRCKQVFNIVGECDVLFSQFSFAAWKGGVDNIKWRNLAAKEKLNTLKLQVKYFKPKVLVPFASYIYFSNQVNSYLNDSSNRPEKVIDTFLDNKVSVNIMKPFECFENILENFNNNDSLLFWNKAFEAVNESEFKVFDTIDIQTLEDSFTKYQQRVFKNNSMLFMKIIRLVSPIYAFKPIVIKINDLNINVNFDIFSEKLSTTLLNADVSMSSESFNFIMTNSFGFDTLTVNGCFEEESDSGFSRAARTLAIENFNNMGISFKPSVIFNIQLITLFISRLKDVSKKIRLSSRISN